MYKIRQVDYYDYRELREKAFRTKSQEDFNALGEWLERFNPWAWNGESYDIDGGYRLFPVYEDAGEDEVKIVRWEAR